MDRRVPNLDKAAALIGYRPTRLLDEIIEDVVEHTRGRTEQHVSG